MENYAILIKTARKKANITQCELANLCGISRGELIHLENGKVKKPRLSILKVLADYLPIDEKALRVAAGYVPVYSEKDNSLGALIERARLDLFLSQCDLAKYCNLSIDTIQYIESGRTKKPQERVLAVLAKNLSIDLYLLEKAI